MQKRNPGRRQAPGTAEIGQLEKWELKSNRGNFSLFSRSMEFRDKKEK